MGSYREVYDKGSDYFHNAVGLEKSNRFGEEVTVNIALFSAEYLLTSVLTKNNIALYGHGLTEILKALTFNRIIPPKIRDQAKILDQGCGCNGAVPSRSEVRDFIESLRKIKQWVDTQIKTEVLA